jgi:hypothetical protein
MSVLSTVRSGFSSSGRTVRDYPGRIRRAAAVPVSKRGQ